METNNWSDLLIGGLALFIVIAGLFMLFQGISAIEDKNK
jgi:hypothetical protein